jgi:hypothetical protein
MRGRFIRLFKNGANSSSVVEAFLAASSSEPASDNCTHIVVSYEVFVFAHFFENALQFRLQKVVKGHVFKASGHSCTTSIKCPNLKHDMP